MNTLVATAVAAAMILPAGTTVEPNPYDPSITVEKWKSVGRDRDPVHPPHNDPAGDPATAPPNRSKPVENLCDFDDQELAVCAPSDTPTPTDDPAVTPGDVEREVRRVGLPRLTTRIQPAGTTLVNLETIFHTTADPFERTVRILDSTVELQATAQTYTWHHGDGTSQVTRTAGRPYPAMDIVHQYAKPGSVTARVDVTYHVTYRIDNGDWQDLDTTITAAGPTTALRIREARPVLTRAP